MTTHHIYTMCVESIYPLYIAKAEKKGCTKREVDEIFCWLTGYSHEKLETQFEKQLDLGTFFTEDPQLNSSRALIKGAICSVRE